MSDTAELLELGRELHKAGERRYGEVYFVDGQMCIDMPPMMGDEPELEADRSQLTDQQRRELEEDLERQERYFQAAERESVLRDEFGDY